MVTFSSSPNLSRYAPPPDTLNFKFFLLSHYLKKYGQAKPNNKPKTIYNTFTQGK